ncbi:MAG: acyl--CoA ligase [Proteobacteria bacterium]|nr:acyl--CoA ligase [Pseudomonadota bacterium]
MNEIRFDFLWQYVEYWAGINPSFPAMRFDDRTISYGDFEEKTDNLAKSFLDMGVVKGEVIATMLPSSPEYIMSLIAADKIGAVICALDVKYKTADLKKFISHLNPKVLVALSHQEDYDIAQTLKEVERELDIDGTIQYVMVGDSQIGGSFQDRLKPTSSPDDPLKEAKAGQQKDDGMLIVFTGGTTGVPKAALLSKINVAGMAVAETNYLNRYIAEDADNMRMKTIVSLPPSHVGGTVEMMGTGIVGGLEMIVHDTWSPNRVLETIQEEKVPWVGGVPTMYAIMLLMPDIGEYDLSSLKLAIMSGEKVDTELLEMIRDKICPNIVIGYGSTESGSEVTFTEPGEDFARIVNGYVGKALPGMEIKIVDDEEKEVPSETVGEVLVRGDFAIKSYFKMPDEDKAGFTKDQGYCKTGDLGYTTSDGGLYIKGRKKHIIRVGGYTVMPTEIEEVATQDPSVGMAAAIGVPDKILGEVPWLVVCPAPGASVDEQEIIELCRKELAKFKVPKRVVVRDELPITRIGKVHRVEVQNEIIDLIEGGKL